MSNLSNVCLSIRSSNNKTSTAKGYASNGKALVSFTNKGGVNTLKAYPKADKVPSYLLMDEKEYTAYGNAIKYVYNSACHVNTSTTNKEDKSIIKVYTTDFHSCLSDLANIVFGETFSMQEYPSFGTEVLAMAKTYLDQWEEKYPPAFLIDNNSEIWGVVRGGYEIKSPEAILEIPEDERIVLICNMYYDAVAKQLNEMGVRYDYFWDQYYI